MTTSDSEKPQNEPGQPAGAAASGVIGLSALGAVLGLCCALPWAAVFGVGGAVLIAEWGETLRPFVLGAAGLLLAFGFWRLYRPRRVCADGTCERKPSAALHVGLWLSAALLLTALFADELVWSALGSAQAMPAAPTAPAPARNALVMLDDTQARLREDFNRDRGKVRLMLLSGPSCGVCLRAMKQIDTALLTGNADPALRTYVVYLPTLGATEGDARAATTLITGGNAVHYWDGGGQTGVRYAETLGLRDGDKVIYAWDIWMVYGPDAVWDGAQPPKPDFTMHQLPNLERFGYARLNAEEFARQARQRLTASADARAS